LAALAADPNNTQTVVSASNPFQANGNVPDTAYGLCNYTASAARLYYGGTTATTNPLNSSMTPFNTPTAKSAFSTSATYPFVNMAPFYFPLTYTSNVTSTGNVNASATPIIGLFDWRPEYMDEGLVAAESGDNGKTWYFMPNTLELAAGNNVCPATLQSDNSATTAGDGWGHATIVQLPGSNAKTGGQMLYMLNRTPAAVDVAPLNVIQLTNVSPKFPIQNTNATTVGSQDINAIQTALTNTPGATSPVVVQQTVGLLNPDGILAVVPNTTPGTPTTVLYVQKILNGDNTGSTALPAAQQCAKAPSSGKTNHDITYVRLATTTDGVHFTDEGAVNGLNDPTTVDYNGTRWVTPRGTLIDINGDGSRWGLLFSAGNCLDADSDAFHYIGYAESSDLKNWTVYNDINHPIASINTITAKNQGGNQSTVTIPANPPLIPTRSWFAQRVYAPSGIQIDPTHLSVTFAGYGV